MTTGEWEPETENIEINKEVRKQFQLANKERTIKLEWIKGHSGDKGNDWADKLADRGALGKISPQSKRWAPPPLGYKTKQIRRRKHETPKIL